MEEYKLPEVDVRFFRTVFIHCANVELDQIERKSFLLEFSRKGSGHKRLFRDGIKELYSLVTATEVNKRIDIWEREVLSDRNPIYKHLPMPIKRKFVNWSEANRNIILKNPVVELFIFDDDGEPKENREVYAMNVDSEDLDQLYTKKGKLRDYNGQLAKWISLHRVAIDFDIKDDTIYVGGDSRWKTVDELLVYLDKLKASELE